jgi:hypothetical protein
MNYWKGISIPSAFSTLPMGNIGKIRIIQLRHEDTVIEGDNALKEYITSYYKNVFGQLKPSSFSIDESRVDDIVQVSQEKNDLLVEPFTVDEVQ